MAQLESSVRFRAGRMALLILAGFLPAAAPQPASTAPAVTPWGQPFLGLRARLHSPAEVEQNDLLPITLDVQCDPAALTPGVDSLDLDAYQRGLQLALHNVATGKTVTVRPFEPQTPPAVGDTAHPVKLDGKTINEFSCSMPLRGSGVMPGAYDLAVSFTRATVPGHPNVWLGSVTSGTIRIKITPETLKPLTLVVPHDLSADAAGNVRFHTADGDKVEVKLGNGLTLGTRVLVNGDMRSLASGTLRDNEDLGSVKDATLKGPNVEFTIEIFATPRPPEHMWSPDPAQEGYQTLWKKSFSVPKSPTP